MGQTSLSQLTGWGNFYVIVGSSAGALTGLQFVVMTLISQTQMTGSLREIRAFGTPTVVHFCAALLISAIMAAPWHDVFQADVCVAVCGGAVIAYCLTVLWHARKAAYKPDVEDWTWYAALPLIAYAALTTAAILFWRSSVLSLFVIAGTTLLFLFIGIHNAWDTVTYVTLQRWQGSPEGERKNQS